MGANGKQPPNFNFTRTTYEKIKSLVASFVPVMSGFSFITVRHCAILRSEEEYLAGKLILKCPFSLALLEWFY